MNSKYTQDFLLRKGQPWMLGLLDGSLSTLAALFAAATASGDPMVAFKVGLATTVGAAISMGYSEALSDTGEDTGRGTGLSRGLITAAGTFVGGILHTLPFLLASYTLAFNTAVVVVLIEIFLIAWLRHLFFRQPFLSSILHVGIAAVIITATGIFIGEA